MLGMSKSACPGFRRPYYHDLLKFLLISCDCFAIPITGSAYKFRTMSKEITIAQ